MKNEEDPMTFNLPFGVDAGIFFFVPGGLLGAFEGYRGKSWADFFQNSRGLRGDRAYLNDTSDKMKIKESSSGTVQCKSVEIEPEIFVSFQFFQ